MKRLALLTALVIGASRAAGQTAAPFAPEAGAESFGAEISKRGESPRRRVDAALAVLSEWMAEAEAERGFAESVIGFAMPRSIERAGTAERALQACAYASAAVALAAERAQQELEGDAALEIEQDAVHAREVVIPLLAARASVLVATGSGDRARRESLLREARAEARGVEPVSAWAEAQRGAVIAGASYLLGEDKEAIAAADSAMRSVAEGDGAEAVPAGIALEAALIATAASARSEGHEAARRWLARVEQRGAMLPKGIGPRLALADAQFMTAKRGADEAVNQADRVRLLSEAFHAYEPVVGWEEADRQAQNRARERAWWHAKRAAESGDYPFEALPLIAITARARHWVEPTDATRKEAARLFVVLERVRAREGANEPRAVRAEALGAAAGKAWASGVLDLWWQSPLLFLQLAEEYADEGTESLGLHSAVLSASELVRTHPGDAASLAVYTETLRRVHAWPRAAIDRDDARRRLVRVLAEQAANEGDDDAAREAVAVAGAIENDAEARDAWTDACWGWNAVLERTGEQADARALASAVDGAEERIGEQTPALAVYRASAMLALGEIEHAAAIVDRVESIWKDDPALASDGLEASIRVRVAVGDRLGALAAARTLKRTDNTRAQRVVKELADRAWAQIEPLTHRLEPCPSGEPCATPAQIAALSLAAMDEFLVSGMAPSARAGWALLLAGEAAQAAEAFDKVSTALIPMFQRLGGAETLLATGDDTSAFAEYRAIADDTAFSDPGGRDFWRAWTRMLEILARQNKDGARTAEIEREIARLRVMPSAPDHPDCLARLAEIERGLTSRSTGR